MSQFAIDEDTRWLLYGALILLGAAGAITAGRGAAVSLQNSLQARAENVRQVAITAGFGFVVFLAARAVLDF